MYKWGSETGSTIIFHLSELWKAKFFILYDVIFLVRLCREVKCRKALWLQACEALWSNCKRTQSCESRVSLCKIYEQLGETHLGTVQLDFVAETDGSQWGGDSSGEDWNDHQTNQNPDEGECARQHWAGRAVSVAMETSHISSCGVCMKREKAEYAGHGSCEEMNPVKGVSRISLLCRFGKSFCIPRKVALFWEAGPRVLITNKLQQFCVKISADQIINLMYVENTKRREGIGFTLSANPLVICEMSFCMAKSLIRVFNRAKWTFIHVLNGSHHIVIFTPQLSWRRTPTKILPMCPWRKSGEILPDSSRYPKGKVGKMAG